MSWNPIIAGIDASPEGAWAGAAAWRLARETGADCRLIHAVAEHWLPDPDLPFAADDVVTLRRLAAASARQAVVRALAGNMPREAADRIEIRFGRPARVLYDAAHDAEAELAVVGAKRHRRLSHWLAGSTAHDVVRLIDVPVLVATASVARIERVLVAVDLSEVAAPTIAAGERLAALSGASLRLIHVTPRLPAAPDAPVNLDAAAFANVIEDAVERSVWPLVKTRDVERVLRRGGIRREIVSEVETWRADLLVVGSHGHGMVDRMLLGSVTEGLLRALPTSMLVVPAPHRAARRPAPARTAGYAAS